jgi:hypothetical protein
VIDSSPLTSRPVADTAMNAEVAKLLVDAFLSGASEAEMSGILAPSRGSVVRAPSPTPLATIPETDELENTIRDLADGFVHGVFEAIEGHLKSRKRPRKSKPAKNTSRATKHPKRIGK